MIPRTFPSIIEAFQTKMVVYVLPSITGLTAWIDYIPVKGVVTESATLANTYANGGYQVVKSLDSLTGLQAWIGYIPVYEDASYNKPWSTDAGGYVPVGGLFSIPSLFASGAPGAWYDPSDYSTLFQDSAGTTPVTAVEQPVGLMLDKSQGLVLGSERVGATWLGTDATWSQSGSTLIAVLGSNFSIYQTIVPANSFYRVTFEIFDYVAGTLNIRLGNSGAVLANFNANGTYTVTASASGDGSFYWMGNSTFTGKIRNISVKELAGNHAFQATSASRPVLSARYNLLTKTEDFSDAVWTKFRVSITANAATDPLGGNTADKIIPAAGLTAGQLYNATPVTTVNGVTYATVMYVKAAELGFAFITNNTRGSSTQAGVCVNLATGATTNQGANGTYLVTFAGNGWWQVLASTAATSTSGYIEVHPLAAAGLPSSYTGDGTSGIYIWGADLRVANNGITQPAYQRVNTATDYDSTGFLPYLKFDGVDDSLSTNSISFTSTDKMSVFAGVRKLSDTYAAIVGLSVDTAANAGSFELASFSGSFSYLWDSKGTVAARANTSGYAAPITNTLTALGNISGDLATLRVNGAQVAQSTGDQGTGNYGNYPLFIGRRGGSSLPFNGQLYSMIIVGKAVTAGELSSTDTYVNQKTGAY